MAYLRRIKIAELEEIAKTDPEAAEVLQDRREKVCFVNKHSSESEGKFPTFGLGIPHYPKET